MSSRDGELPDLAALAAWAPELAKTFVSLSSDIALVIDKAGVIRNVAQGEADPMAPLANDWVGRPWVDTVSGDTRAKIENLLHEVTTTGIARRREVTHPFQQGGNIPVAYCAIRFGADGPVLATGRDLRAIAAIQQRFLDSQQELERGYWQARQAETRYRLLFQVATDAVLVVDGHTLTILEVNQAASQMFDIAGEQMVGRQITTGFEERSRIGVEELLQLARASGRSGEIRARLLGRMVLTSVAATPFRAEDEMRLLVRVRAVDATNPLPALSDSLARLVDDTSDGVVVTDASGRVLIANAAFIRLVRLNDESELRGRPIVDWLGTPEHPMATLLPQVRRDGVARRVPSWIKVANAPVVQAEVSAALLTEGDQECIGFTIHLLAAHDEAEQSKHELTLGLQQLTERLGQVPVDRLLAAAAALAERHFVSAALAQSHNDAGDAARLLGMTRDAFASMRRRADGGTGDGDGTPPQGR
ncbi:transcriptional regulator PpsR [Variovorax sp. KK3]|uniref:transcriptional regulator PpsR n=1 Tax=Variovorax sp. KK3 TaxID=1855728 RepID=UPI00097BF68C|nr:transcriptional regulator PpsR [Variovorax sp. KK3]